MSGWIIPAPLAMPEQGSPSVTDRGTRELGPAIGRADRFGERLRSLGAERADQIVRASHDALVR